MENGKQVLYFMRRVCLKYNKCVDTFLISITPISSLKIGSYIPNVVPLAPIQYKDIFPV